VIDPELIKAENIKLIRSWNLPVIDHLPTLETEIDLSPQDSNAVARRCMVINHIIGIGFGGDSSELRDAVEEFGLMDSASAKERDFLSRKDHTEQEKIDAGWLVEGMQSFAWCLGLAPLDPFKHCDDDLASKFPAPYNDPSEFIRSATLRPFEEIYRQADLHYRVHWAARNTGLSGTEFPVGEGFLRERRKALDWVVGVEPDWDQVTSDT
jgi:hypothetical protein